MIAPLVSHIRQDRIDASYHVHKEAEACGAPEQ